MILIIKATINLTTIQKRKEICIMGSRRPIIFFLTMAVALAMLAFTHALFGEGKDSPVAKALIEQAESLETQAPNPHGKSNY